MITGQTIFAYGKGKTLIKSPHRPILALTISSEISSAAGIESSPALQSQARSLLRVTCGPRMYLIDRTALADLGEIYAIDDESGSGGAAAQICST
jgi:hypothetical protein